MQHKILNCLECGHIYIPVANEKLCSACASRQEEAYFSIRRYLQEEPDKTIYEVAEAMNMSYGLVSKLVNEGRFLLK